MSFGGVKVLDPDLMCATSTDENNTLLALGSDAIHEHTLREESLQGYDDHHSAVTLVGGARSPQKTKFAGVEAT